MGEYNAGGSLKTMGLSCFQSPFFSTLSFFSPLYLLPSIPFLFFFISVSPPISSASIPFLVFSFSDSPPVSSAFHPLSCLLYLILSTVYSVFHPLSCLLYLSLSTVYSAFHPLSCLLYLSLSLCIFCLPSPFLSSLSQSLPLYLLPSIPFLVFSISVSPPVPSAFHKLTRTNLN